MIYKDFLPNQNMKHFEWTQKQIDTGQLRNKNPLIIEKKKEKNTYILPFLYDKGYPSLSLSLLDWHDVESSITSLMFIRAKPKIQTPILQMDKEKWKKFQNFT